MVSGTVNTSPAYRSGHSDSPIKCKQAGIVSRL
jgi:hypothetical protein